MLSFKRLSYIVLSVAILGGIFLIYNLNESRPVNVQLQNSPAPEREFTEIRQVDEGEKPSVWILGAPEDRPCGKIYANVLQFCEDLHFTVAGKGHLDMDKIEEQDLVILCSSSVSRYADLAELESFIAGGGRVILAAGLTEETEDARLWPTFGIRKKSAGEDCHKLVFKKPLLPVQQEQVYYEGNSGSARIEIADNASVYIEDAENDIPILYTYAPQKGSVCLINGTFLADIRCMGLLTGAIGALLPDFVYPVLGIKAVFLDNFPLITPADDELCRRVYGYSAEGFIRDVVWPAFQGVSLRTDTPYTSGILAAASSGESFEKINSSLFTSVGKSVLQFDGELIYTAECAEDGKVVFNEDLIDQFSESFTNYTVQGLAMKTDHSPLKIPDVPGADIRSVRGMLESREVRLSWESERTVFPAATEGNSMEDGNLFAIYSVLGAYGMVSHVFDADKLIAGVGDTAAWDSGKKQIGLFESEVLAHTLWLESRTLSQTGNDVRSYQNMNYGFIKSGRHMELNFSGAAKGQAFFYHTDDRIADAEGLSYQDVGNGYYLLRIQENHVTITLEEGK